MALASNARYYPNGALAQFSYGNGIVHTLTQNARQLPSRSVDGSVLDLLTALDGNGNVVAITESLWIFQTLRSAMEGRPQIDHASDGFAGARLATEDLHRMCKSSQTPRTPPAADSERVGVPSPGIVAR